jgi:hypothetical protein
LFWYWSLNSGLRQVLYWLNTTPAIFALIILKTEPCFWLRLIWTAILLVYAFHHHWDDHHPHHHTQLFSHWDGVSQTFCAGWPGTMILPISASHIALGWQAHITVPSYWLRWGLCTLCRLASNFDPPDLSLPSS